MSLDCGAPYVGKDRCGCEGCGPVVEPTSAGAGDQGAAAPAGTTYLLEMPFQRPPLNWNDRHNRWKHARLVKEVRRDVAWVAKSYRLPPADRITVQLHYAPGRRGTFDGSNFMATTKPAIDGLVDCGIVEDDDATHVHELTPEIHFPPEPGPRCWLTVTVHKDPPAEAGSQPSTPAGVPPLSGGAS